MSNDATLRAIFPRHRRFPQDTVVKLHSISPGMVFTELVSSGSNAFGSQGRFFVNAVAQAPEVLARGNA